MALADFVAAQGLTQKRAAGEASVPVATFNDVATGRRQATVPTVNKILVWARRYEPGVTYEELFAPELGGKVA